MRTAISFAALFVKVTARIREGGKRSAAMRWTTAAVKVEVLPVPAPARTRIGPALCGGFGLDLGESCGQSRECRVRVKVRIEIRRGVLPAADIIKRIGEGF
jgi:hypothetical protein